MEERDIAAYREILQRFFSGYEEQAFFEIAEFAKGLLVQKQGPDILLVQHATCLKEMLKDVEPISLSRMVLNANDLLLNGIMAYAMNFYSFMDMLEAERKRLSDAKDDLQKKTDELQRNQNALQSILGDLNEKTAELKKANEKLKEVDRLKSMFIASMSHELRTPLNSVIGFSSMMLNEWRGPLTAEQKEDLSIVLRAGKHLLSLINDVIDVSKIEAGAIEPYFEDFDIFDVIMEAVNLLKKDIQGKGLELQTDLIHQNLHTDKRRMLQCITNLLSNAMKFTEKGYVRIQARLVASSKGQVAREDKKALTLDPLDLTLHGNLIEISVEDTGIGIKEDDLPKLFSPFVRLDSPLRSTVPGTGLGLYLTGKLVADVLKGEISVISKYEEGSKFMIKIPVKI